jgi:hypothetical protein
MYCPSMAFKKGQLEFIKWILMFFKKCIDTEFLKSSETDNL